jgi:nicotinate-nucleotide pyrophosphorylase (carboxylating)
MVDVERLPANDADAVAHTALAEDGSRDITTEVTGAADRPMVAAIEYRSGGIVSGLAYADAVATAAGCDPVRWSAGEGEQVTAGAVIGVVRGTYASVLRAERPMLNLLQRACGVANATAMYVAAVAGTRCRVLHTRKTTPGLRRLELRAVLAGGGALHRSGLGDAAMIKDNHWRALDRAGVALRTALGEARARGATMLSVEVESEVQLRRACEAGATRILIDNQSAGTVAQWAVLARQLAPGVEIEATGGITLDTIRAYAEAGADFVSIGALTQGMQSADLALEVTQM